MSSSAAVRARAAHIVAQVATHGHSLDALLAKLSFDKEWRGTSQERGLLRALCYDSVRWYLRLDALLGQLLSRPKQPLTPEMHALAIVGLCQLLYMSVPPHAAVDETVNAARVLKQPRAASLLNAVLRRSQREGERMLAALDRDLATRTAHPPWLVRMLAKDWPDTLDTILSANNQHPPFWLRVNRLRCSGVEYRRKLEAEGHQVTAAPFDDCALMLDRAVDVEELPGFAEGMISVQDAAAQLAAHILAPQAGDRVLDACAAPGGKTCHLLELQPHLKELVAVDVSKERLERVQENLQRLSLQATVVTGDAAEPENWWDGRPFQRILLDVPCSATGVIRRHPDIKLLRRPHDIPALTARQLRILERAWTLLAPGGRLLYASCSALQAENSAIVTTFLRANAQARADARDITQIALTEAGIHDAGAGTHMVARLPGYAIAAGAGGMDGFYYACLEKLKG